MVPWHSDFRWTWRGKVDVPEVGNYQLARRLVDCNLLALRPEPDEPKITGLLAARDLIITPCAACPCCDRCTCSGRKLTDEPAWHNADDLTSVGDGYFAQPGQYDVMQRDGCFMVIMRPRLGDDLTVRQIAPGDVILTECSACPCCQGCACSETVGDTDEEQLCVNCAGYRRWQSEMAARWMALRSQRHRSGMFVQVNRRTHTLTCARLRAMLQETIDYLQGGCEGNHGSLVCAWKDWEVPEVLADDQLEDRPPCAACKPNTSSRSQLRRPEPQLEGQLTIGI